MLLIKPKIFLHLSAANTDYEKFVSTLGIPSYNFYIGQTSKQLKVRTLSGPDTLKLFRHIYWYSQPAAFHWPQYNTPGTRFVEKIFKINELLSACPENVTENVIQKYESMTREWGMKFLEVYQTKKVTHDDLSCWWIYAHSLMLDLLHSTRAGEV